MSSVWGRESEVSIEDEVVRLARLAAAVGVGGLVCSGQEAARVRQEIGTRLTLVVPGIRFADDGADDQARVVTPGAAVRAGADFVVVGRAVTAASDPAAAMARLVAELKSALNE